MIKNSQYEQYREVIKLLFEHADQFNTKISAPPSEAATAKSMRALSSLMEGKSLLSRPNYAIELYDTDMNDLFWVLMNLFAEDNGIRTDAYQKHALFTLRDKSLYDTVEKKLNALGVKFKGFPNDKTADGYFDSDIDVNNVSPFPGNMGIKPGIRKYS